MDTTGSSITAFDRIIGHFKVRQWFKYAIRTDETVVDQSVLLELKYGLKIIDYWHYTHSPWK